MRTNFGAFLQNYIGETAVAKFIIRHEVGPPGKLMADLMEIKTNEKRRKKRNDTMIKILCARYAQTNDVGLNDVHAQLNALKKTK